MTLYELTSLAREQGLDDTVVTGITDDTGRFQKGNVFVCIKGKRFDGHSVAEKMLSEGAAAVVTEIDLGLEQQIVVSDTRKALSSLSSSFYNNPTRKLKLIGVTGTNGKTTTVAIIKHILTSFGHKVGTIGTIGIDVGKEFFESDHDVPTTPRPTELYRYFAMMRDNGVEYCVMEASSQALAQHRFSNEEFECGVFTNLTQDHLDYHGTMENYYKAKKLLFKMSKRAVVCTDDKYGERLYKELGTEKTGCSVDGVSDFYSVNIKLRGTGVTYWLSSQRDEKSFPVSFSIPGRFSVQNSMAAVAACNALGFDLGKCIDALSSFSGVRGRSEVVYSGKITVLCDYAHTADALEKFLTDLRGFASGRIICVFGAAGERDETKRSAMGRTVASLSDYMVITSDNPRFEDQQRIISQVEHGAQSLTTPYNTFIDRREAIEFALSIARDGDTVALCGKGHENYQVIKDEYLYFNEKEIVNEIMSNREGKDK